MTVRFFKIFGFIVFLAITSYVMFIAKTMWSYRANVVGSVCVQQQFRTNIYDFVDCSSNKLIVSDVHGWIIDSDFLYGSNGKGLYFSIFLGDGFVNSYQAMRELDNFLEKNGLQFYDMNREENISHLKYGNGRSRIYK